MNGRVKQLLPVKRRNQLNRNGILSIEQFQAVVKHERARSERDGSEFSLVVFEIAEFEKYEFTLTQYMCALRQRVRTIDEVGWFDDRLLGVLLPCTNHEGAWTFAIDFGRDVLSAQRVPPFSVYSYPNQWYFDDFKGKDKDKSDNNTNGSNRQQENQKNYHPSASDSKFVVAIEKLGAIFSNRLPIWKRSLDIFGSLIGILLFSPFWLILSIYIKIVSPGPLLFKQQRVGYKGIAFTFLKFRTMKPKTNQVSHQKHAVNFIHTDISMEKLDKRGDSRIIPGGKIIRKMCIDESPQFINILKGEMSLVGPRPCIPYEAEEYLRWHKQRFDVVPGLTGLWQVSGKNKLTFKQMIRLDITYIENMSFWNDIQILFLTIPAIIEMVFEAVVRRLSKNQNKKPQIINSKANICQTLETFTGVDTFID